MMPLLYRMYSKAWLGRPLQEGHMSKPGVVVGHISVAEA